MQVMPLFVVWCLVVWCLELGSGSVVVGELKAPGAVGFRRLRREARGFLDVGPVGCGTVWVWVARGRVGSASAPAARRPYVLRTA
jgi:hypothetical protein